MAHTHHHQHSEHHHHGHKGHHHHHGPANYNTAFAVAVVFNFIFVLIEAVYAFKAHSMGLLADAGHNLGDVLGLTFAWIASWLLTKSATERFSYGFKRTTILASLMNALILVATSTIIAYESVIKLMYPTAVNELTIIIVASIGILMNGSTALLFMGGRHQDLNIKGAFLHLAYDALISLGVVVAGIIIYFTGWLELDPLVGLLIVAAILVGTWGLLRNSVNLIMDAVPHGIDQRGVREYLSSLPGVTAVHDLHIWGLSTQEIALTAHIVVPEGEIRDIDYQQINHELRVKFDIHHVTLQVESGTEEDPCGRVTAC